VCASKVPLNVPMFVASADNFWSAGSSCERVKDGNRDRLRSNASTSQVEDTMGTRKILVSFYPEKLITTRKL
jgi:hypothetical protein